MASSALKVPITALMKEDVLIGRGDRVVKLGFVEIHVYALELYVAPEQCRTALQQFAGMDLNGLILRGSSFYSSFTSGKFTKTFQLKFCRTISQDKLVGGFEKPLKSRCDAAHMEDAELMLQNLVPPEGVVQGDVLSLVCHGDGETLTGLYMPASSSDEQELINLKSGGPGGAWLALQNIYFDDNTALPTIRHSAIADLPNVLIVSSSVPREPSQKDIEIAVEEELVHPGTAKKTWRKFAGRTKGPSGDKFRDLALGVVTALGMRKPKSTSQGAVETKTGTTTSTPNDNTNAEMKELQKQVQQLELQKQELQQSRADTEQQLDESDKEFPLKIVAALALVEAVYIILESVVELSVSSLEKFQMYVAVAIGLAGWKNLMETKKEKKKTE